ncbi:bifunctional DNA-formamidopyrimidine glycosylase/DNA-(apurinic or apyrimidinic site) lyase [Patescibacteria group bacterium]|nr:bifunctional DNA-formamidopyrimidine glycosylase/DNA-(apurinic or apyrimidinic site) lyase [Patescibacteria group bacterium]
MPELPEVEIIKRTLAAKTLGSVITGLEILTPKSFIGHPDDVLNRKITGFTRLGKQLSIHLSNHQILLVHLKMTGQLVYLPHVSRPVKGGSQRVLLGHPTKNMHTQTLPNHSTRLIFTFNSGDCLYFNDQRKFGWIRVLTPADLAQAQANVGLDVLDPHFTLAYFRRQLQATRRPVKVVLLDQNRFAGIGNIYANDALWLAKINPRTPANSIPSANLPKLYRAVIKIIKESIAHGGSTTRDQSYITPTGAHGAHQFYFRVYDRTQQPCFRCGTPIKRLSLGGRGTFYCPHCQP